ncbi:hypothetical protein FK521_27960, partial [Klebsiella pneumoniae]|nr:hypothetical protein [Klebsiella pneumoniae]
ALRQCQPYPSGAYETWAINQGHDVTYSRVYAGDRLPDDAVGIDFLVVMGGPQDPDTTLEACPHFNAKAEQALIASAVKTEAITSFRTVLAELGLE